MEVYYLQSEFPNASIYISKTGKTQVYKKFNSLEEFIIHYYTLCESEYDKNGYKINPNKGTMYKVFPVLSNKIMAETQLML